jgi:hypothetical protein
VGSVQVLVKNRAVYIIIISAIVNRIQIDTNVTKAFRKDELGRLRHKKEMPRRRMVE